MTQLLINWEIYMGGSRQGANVTIRNTQDTNQDISGTVSGWMRWKDDHMVYCTRGKAEYAVIRRWSYSADTMDIEKVVIVPLPERMKGAAYGSKTFTPVEPPNE